ncbi:MAG: DUF4166 domain-containing protein [Halopseudomonas aestusnigri]
MNSEEPIFKSVFGKDWDNLPPVMQKHYAVRANSDDQVTVEGKLDIKISPVVSWMAKITGMLLAYSGDAVPVTVIFRSDKKSGQQLSPQSKSFYFDRTFHFPDKGDITFRSRMEHVKDNILIEFMRFGIGWKLSYEWDGEKVILRHKGYIWRIFGTMIPVPLSLIMGKGYAEEAPLSEDSFSMWTHANHDLFGPTFGYAGEFRVTEVSCSNQS